MPTADANASANDDIVLPPSVVCTLDQQGLRDRSLEWSDLAAIKLASERIEGGVASTYPAAYAELIEDLAAREQSCCGSWLRSRTERMVDEIRLELTTTNPDGIQVILAMSGFEE